MDKDFTEGYKLSYDKAYAVRLFRLPDAEDGSIRLSIEVMMRDGGYVFFKLPENLWLTPDNPVRSGDLLDWDNDRHILFFTTNDQSKAFIYDVALGKLVCRDIEPHDGNLEWDENNKRWLLPYVVTFTRGQFQTKQVQSMPMLDLNAPEADLYNLAAVKGSTPKPTPRNKEEDSDHIVLDTPDARFYLLLTKAQKHSPSDPTLWEVELIDAKRHAIVSEKLPFLITGSDAIRFHGERVHMHGVGRNADISYGYIFHITPTDTLNKDTLNMFVQDFAPTHPESFIWDGEFWRAVIKGKVIYPGRFYFDNMYYEKIPLCEKPLPTSVLKVLPQTDDLQKLIEERKAKELKRKQEEYDRDNTPADEIFKRMEESNRNLRSRHNNREPAGESKMPKRSKTGGRSWDFLTSNWFIVLVTLLMVAAVFGMLAYSAAGNHIPPVAARNLYTAIVALFVLDFNVIVARTQKDKKPYDFTLPQSQRMIMGMASPFVLLAIIIVLSRTLDNLAGSGMSVLMSFVCAAATLPLMLKGHSLRRHATGNREYNTGCWLQWCGIWTLILTLIGVIWMLVDLNG